MKEIFLALVNFSMMVDSRFKILFFDIESSSAFSLDWDRMADKTTPASKAGRIIPPCELLGSVAARGAGVAAVPTELTLLCVTTQSTREQAAQLAATHYQPTAIRIRTKAALRALLMV